jgi:hypothetical protein
MLSSILHYLTFTKLLKFIQLKFYNIIDICFGVNIKQFPIYFHLINFKKKTLIIFHLFNI